VSWRYWHCWWAMTEALLIFDVTWWWYVTCVSDISIPDIICYYFTTYDDVGCYCRRPGNTYWLWRIDRYGCWWYSPILRTIDSLCRSPFISVFGAYLQSIISIGISRRTMILLFISLLIFPVCGLILFDYHCPYSIFVTYAFAAIYTFHLIPDIATLLFWHDDIVIPDSAGDTFVPILSTLFWWHSVLVWPDDDDIYSADPVDLRDLNRLTDVRMTCVFIYYFRCPIPLRPTYFYFYCTFLHCWYCCVYLCGDPTARSIFWLSYILCYAVLSIDCSWHTVYLFGIYHFICVDVNEADDILYGGCYLIHLCRLFRCDPVTTFYSMPLHSYWLLRYCIYQCVIPLWGLHFTSSDWYSLFLILQWLVMTTVRYCGICPDVTPGIYYWYGYSPDALRLIVSFWRVSMMFYWYACWYLFVEAIIDSVFIDLLLMTVDDPIQWPLSDYSDLLWLGIILLDDAVIR